MKSGKIVTALALVALAGAGCAAGARNYGAALSAGTAVPAAQVLAQPESYDGRALIVEGKVADVCQVKGCWMTMVDGGREMRVRFKDYAFFVPRDSGGRTARLEGLFRIETTPVDEARHYLEDAGKHDEAMKITEPVTSYTFMASGVRLSR